MLSILQARPVRRGKPPVIQIHAEMVAYVKKAPKDVFVFVLKDSGASTATPELSSIACHMHVGRNQFALQGSMWGFNFSYSFLSWWEENKKLHVKMNIEFWNEIKWLHSEDCNGN